jgi:hypothetical protein
MVWLTRSQVWQLVANYTEDAGLKDLLRCAVWRPRMLERGWSGAFADEFRGIDAGFATFLRGME